MDFLEIGGISVFIAFAAGVLSVASPCVLPMIPAYLGYLTGAAVDAPAPEPVPATTAAATATATPGGDGGGTAAIALGGGGGLSTGADTGPPSAFLHALAFVLGFSLIFIAFGASVGLLGFFLGGSNQFFIRDQQDLILKFAGGALIILGLHLSGVITIPLLDTERRLNLKTGDRVGYTRSFIVGSSFSAGWSPCIGPTLGAVLALSAASASVWQGLLLLAVYSAGLSIPFLAMGLAFNAVKPVFNWLKRYMGIINYASGALIIVVGILIFTNSLINLNSLFNFGFLTDISSEA
jgi:cytochrome c-type biogenesis protein